VTSKAEEWGLTSMLTPLLDKNGKNVIVGNKPAMKLDIPTFVNVFVPVVMAYVKMRWAKLFNDRDRVPLYKYEPLRQSVSNRLKAQIISSSVERTSVDMGMRATERQAIFQMLLYGICLSFPRESYYREKQRIDGKEKIVKEGLRFTTPHPSRIFYNLAHPTHTFNSDTGADFGGFWQVERFGDIAMNDAYWNRNNITWGKGSGQWPWSPKFSLYSSFFPCHVRFPDLTGWKAQSDLDREKNAFRYDDNYYDAAVNIVPVFHKIVPKDWGLYDYEYPVWHRFVYAGDGTVIHCEPLAYCPITAYLYDYDANRSRNASLGLEVIPWQDELGNLLSQYLLSVRKNLTRVVFWNSDILAAEEVREVKNQGEKLYQELRFIEFSGKKMQWGQDSVQQAFFPVQFNPVNTQEIMVSIGTVLNMMERALGFSSQELAASASHEQSATEVKVVGAATSNKLQFTASFIDDAWWSRKRQLYDALMAYGSDQIFAEVADLNDADAAALKDMGFKIEDGEKGDTHVGVSGPKKNIELTAFASERDGVDRIEDAKIAAAMIQVFQSILANPVIMQEAGVKQIFDLFNQILPYTGFPKEFKLRFDKALKPEQNAQMGADQLKQFAQQTMEGAQKAGAEAAQKVVGDEMAKLGDVVKTQVMQPIAAQMQKVQQDTEAVVQKIAQKDQQQDAALTAFAQQIQKIEQAVGMLVQAAQAPPPVPPGMMPPGGPPPEAIIGGPPVGGPPAVGAPPPGMV
jgi:hypothetical protein